MEILISVGAAARAFTNSVRGEYDVQEVLDLMLEKTPLVAVPVSGGEAFGIVKRVQEGGDVSPSAREQ